MDGDNARKSSTVNTRGGEGRGEWFLVAVGNRGIKRPASIKSGTTVLEFSFSLSLSLSP